MQNATGDSDLLLNGQEGNSMGLSNDEIAATKPVAIGKTLSSLSRPMVCGGGPGAKRPVSNLQSQKMSAISTNLESS